MAKVRYAFSLYVTACCIAFLIQTAIASAAELPGTGKDAGKTVVYRDTWGVPHIYAPTMEAGLYAMGWAQAEDRPEELLKNFMRALGQSAKFAGAQALDMDIRARMWDHYGVSKRNYEQINPEVRKHFEAYCAGVNDFFKAHPEDVPSWWGDRPVDPYMVIAFARLFLYNWSVDDAFDDLERGGIKRGYDRELRGSNEFAIAPSRTAVNAAILYVDPHLSWFGPERFWEFRVHAGEWEGSGFTLAGVPYIGLGHNANVGWAMTTGGPDTADIYELTLKEDGSPEYLYDGRWRKLEVREETFEIKDAEPKTLRLYASHHGPIVAIQGNKAYAAKISYADCVQINEAWYYFNIAKDYTGVMRGLDLNMLFPQNVMVADTSGNIYYQRTGRVPRRPSGYDWSKPVDGSTSATEWQGIIPASEHVQLLNPPQGYMQNCNIPPDAMMVKSPLQPEKYLPEIFSDLSHGPRGGWTNQRGARAVQLLHNDDHVTIEEAIQYALDIQPYGVERWLNVLFQADDKFGSELQDNSDYRSGLQELRTWDKQLDAASTAALKYYYWRTLLNAKYPQEMPEVRRRIDQYYSLVKGEEPMPVSLSDEELQAAAHTFAEAMAQLKADFGSLDVSFGQKFRVGRDDKSWPCSGGGGEEIGITTLRNIHYGQERPDKTRWGSGGQTSTQIIVFTKPIQSWTQPPIGQSDRKSSPHYCDQAEKLFSPRKMKPTWWLPQDLADHIESRTELSPKM